MKPFLWAFFLTITTDVNSSQISQNTSTLNWSKSFLKLTMVLNISHLIWRDQYFDWVYSIKLWCLTTYLDPVSVSVMFLEEIIALPWETFMPNVCALKTKKKKKKKQSETLLVLKKWNLWIGDSRHIVKVCALRTASSQKRWKSMHLQYSPDNLTLANSHLPDNSHGCPVHNLPLLTKLR